MQSVLKRRLRACLSLVACLLATAAAAAQQDVPAAPPLSLDRLAGMSWSELECLYRAADAGSIPVGYAAGKAIYCPCSRLAGVRSKATDALWRGKVFDGAGGLVNQWRGFRAIEARVGYGPSRLDGKPSILMDYGQTSWVWSDVRDEAREVAPGLYLGRMYRCRHGRLEFQVFFALETCPASCNGD